MKQIVLGTAGHIDHGKTTLIKALTGIETDRLKEEKARGITIELGFAYLDLPGGERLGIVDVPGHEKFVKNMVAGAAGIDLVALVIAADEGVMPQTREHLDICKLLGVGHGLVVLTKIDMVDEEWLDLVTEDVAEYVEGTFLEDAPIIPVSGVSGQGIPELKDALAELVAGLDEQPAEGPFRLPVDRVFTMKGFGTVITGTATGGQIAIGQEVSIYPRGVTAKVRGLQVHNEEVTQARRGQRTAINLQGLEKAGVERGDVLATPGSLEPSLWLDLEVNALADMARPLKHRAPIRLHTGSAEVLGRVLWLDRDELLPGGTALGQVRLESPVAVMAGDRYVLRSYSPVHTIAGGVVLHPHPGRHKRNRPEIMADLKTLVKGEARDKVAVHARLAGEGGLSPADLPRLVPMSPKALDNLVGDMLSKQELVRFDKEGGRMIAAPVQQELMDQALELLTTYHQANPLKPGMPREELRRRLISSEDPKLFAHLMRKLEGGQAVVAEKDLLRLPGHQVQLAGADKALRERIEKAYAEGGLAPPNLKDVIGGDNPAQAKQVLAVLVDEGVLVKVKQELYYDAQSLADIKKRLVEFLEANEKIEASQFKEMTGLSRKYIIPLLEHFDSTMLTMRVGDHRVLRGR
ncbi:MAG: selenocysteine-specific translation elongation factor [Desulfarculus sp.]|nr:selenocysteine-specific translation elongation factor [Pseudomonadota bacterium]MBV1716740.1 selenocysteine-specific translation elongation factor [Desulfarculus sp.]MBU4573396.1 selenocysteine-specific translation elongation factor [Pseudomonadota bacterium]MBU4596516.1 selenocysteine-specific translation elongation factor [Pseudomonadota bacterium]MBV1738983.1 selenocysteine-specific translation elongation factor [Desulfarculus sp.]